MVVDQTSSADRLKAALLLQVRNANKSSPTLIKEVPLMIYFKVHLTIIGQYHSIDNAIY